MRSNVGPRNLGDTRLSNLRLRSFISGTAITFMLSISGLFYAVAPASAAAPIIGLQASPAALTGASSLAIGPQPEGFPTKTWYGDDTEVQYSATGTGLIVTSINGSVQNQSGGTMASMNVILRHYRNGVQVDQFAFDKAYNVQNGQWESFGYDDPNGAFLTFGFKNGDVVYLSLLINGQNDLGPSFTVKS